MERVPTPHIRELARAWYARNKDRLRQKKLDACHRYRQKKRGAIPPLSAKPAMGVVSNSDSDSDSDPEPEPEPEEIHPIELPRTVQRGSFFVSFK